MQPIVKHSLVLVGTVGAVAWMFGPSRSPAPDAAPDRQTLALEVRDKVHDGNSDSGFVGEDTIIERDASGQFHLKARVNGEETRFLVDTGADIVALTPATAERLGIEVSADDYKPIIRTASGEANAAPVRIDTFELGGEEFQNVEALVGEGLETNLLGQSMLRRLGKVELQGDRMVIAHK